MRVRILRGQHLMLKILDMLPERGNVRSEDNLIVDRQRLEDGLNVLGKVGGIFRHDAVVLRVMFRDKERSVAITDWKKKERSPKRDCFGRWYPARGTAVHDKGGMSSADTNMKQLEEAERSF